MTEIQMPRFSDTMEEGVIASWHKQVGDTINRGDVVAEIETDKAIVELEAYDAGVLEEVLVGVGKTVPIGTPIGVLSDGSSAAAASPDLGTVPESGDPRPTPETQPPQEKQPFRADQPGEPPRAGQESRVRSREVDTSDRKPKASPLAKVVAKERGVDLARLSGTGPGGRIIRADIEAAAAPAPDTAPQQSGPAEGSTGGSAVLVPGSATGEEPAEVEEVPLSNIRKVTAKRLTESKQQAPHFYLTSTVDVTALIAFRSDLNERLQAANGPKVSLNDLVVKAVASVLCANPWVNVSFRGDTLLRYKRIHLGVAVATESGLVVPVLSDADRKSVSEIAVEGREKAVRARDGKLKPDEMSGSTFTTSNLGMFGIEEFSAVINPPEAAILAVGAIRDEVQVRNGEFVARKVLRLTLSADHRAVDGAVGAMFLQQLTGLLEDPLRILA